MPIGKILLRPQLHREAFAVSCACFKDVNRGTTNKKYAKIPGNLRNYFAASTAAISLLGNANSSASYIYILSISVRSLPNL